MSCLQDVHAVKRALLLNVIWDLLWWKNGIEASPRATITSTVALCIKVLGVFSECP